ncbi:MAG: hypothetical protein ACWA5X_11340 [bacterium]
MKKMLLRSSFLVLVGFSHLAAAHPGPLPHVPVHSDFAHLMLHGLMLLPVVALAYLFIRRVIREKKLGQRD